MASENINDDLHLGKIPLEQAAVFQCDLQEKFRPAMLHFAQVIANAKKLVDCTKILKVPLIVTEQYPKGLGSTVSEIDVQHALGNIPKTKFSMVVPEVESLMKETWGGRLKCAILFGVEAHVCVEQTAMDLISRGIKVHVVADATTSRTQEDRMLAFERMRQMGCFVTTSENVIYKLLGDKDHLLFNEIRPLIKDASLETGLVSKMEDTVMVKLTWKQKIELAHSVLIKLIADGQTKLSLHEAVRELVALKSELANIGQAPRPKVSAAKYSSERRNPKRSAQLSRPARGAVKTADTLCCRFCDKMFPRKQDLERHIRTHDPASSYLCEECGKSYRSPDGLAYHKEKLHSAASALTFQCPGELDEPGKPRKPCDKAFASKFQLRIHLKNSHRRAKSINICSECDPPATFQRTDVFKAHLALHSSGRRLFSCQHCSKSFSTRSNLASHSRTHQSAPAQSCDVCKFTCQRPEDLREHTKRVHPGDYALQTVFGDSLEELQ